MSSPKITPLEKLSMKEFEQVVDHWTNITDMYKYIKIIRSHRVESCESKELKSIPSAEDILKAILGQGGEHDRG